MPEHIKLVYMLEDDSDDRYITETTIAELDLPIEIRFFSDSSHFVNFLSEAETASLILIDYNSKPDNGVDVLKTIKASNKHSGTPVVILSDSQLARFKAECYANGASSFIQKPSKMDKTKFVVQEFFNYWLQVAEI